MSYFCAWHRSSPNTNKVVCSRYANRELALSHRKDRGAWQYEPVDSRALEPAMPECGQVNVQAAGVSMAAACNLAIAEFLFALGLGEC
jgi:hypothetical protein